MRLCAGRAGKSTMGSCMKKKPIDPAQILINRKEWEDPDHWGGPYDTAVYFSRKDSRVWVPHRRPGFGHTLNLAHPAGVTWALVICAIIIVVLVAVTWKILPWAEWVLQWIIYDRTPSP